MCARCCEYFEFISLFFSLFLFSQFLPLPLSLSLATLDGGIGCLLPVPEKVYRRLSMLQVKMTHGMRHLAGLNPKGFR